MTLEIHAISTSVSVQVSGGDGHLSAEIDGRVWGYNGGRSQYYPGDSCYVIVYQSTNVNVPDTGRCSLSGVDFKKDSGKATGYNLKRESITFTSPIAQAGKPLPRTGVINSGGAGDFFDCSSPEYLPQTTILRLKEWKATLDPASAPPSGFVYIEYTPESSIWAFKDLKRNPQLINTQVHGYIHGVARAMTTNSNSWVPLT